MTTLADKFVKKLINMSVDRGEGIVNTTGDNGIVKVYFEDGSMCDFTTPTAQDPRRSTAAHCSRCGAAWPPGRHDCPTGP